VKNGFSNAAYQVAMAGIVKTLPIAPASSQPMMHAINRTGFMCYSHEDAAFIGSGA
jgi:hypothetical protein